MGLLSLTLPTIGSPNATEDAKVRTALSSIATEFNGNIEKTNLKANLQALLVPTGSILAFGGSSAPTGFLLCDGSATNRGSFSALYAVIGDSYGAGDGSTTFNVPDLRGRVPFGMGTHTLCDALGENEGATVANRNPNHRHQFTAYSSSIDNDGLAGGFANGGFTTTIGDGTIDDGVAYQVVNYIIKT